MNLAVQLVSEHTVRHLHARFLLCIQWNPSIRTSLKGGSTSPLIYLDDNVIKHCRELTAPILGYQLDEHKMELLKEVCRTWITVRAHSFVEGCNFTLHKNFEHGTRTKTLKSIGAEKAT